MSPLETEHGDRICPTCGALMDYTHHAHVEHVGGVKVVDKTSFAWQCSACGECDLSLEELAGYERRAAALVLRDGSGVNGGVVRDARKALGLKQADLALLLGCEPETLSRWETGSRRVPRSEQLAMVALLDGVEQWTIDLAAMVSAARDGRPVEPPHELEVRVRKAAG